MGADLDMENSVSECKIDKERVSSRQGQLYTLGSVIGFNHTHLQLALTARGRSPHTDLLANNDPKPH